MGVEVTIKTSLTISSGMTPNELIAALKELDQDSRLSLSVRAGDPKDQRDWDTATLSTTHNKLD